MIEQKHLRVSTWPIQLVGWSGAIMFSFFTVLSWSSKEFWPSLTFIVFTLLSFRFALLTGPVTGTFEALGVSTLLGRFQIPWQDIQRIEKGSNNWVFFTDQKHMSIPAPSFWIGRDKHALAATIDSIIRDRNIDMKAKLRADLLFQKHTKVA
jgi:hypothetical protein